MAHEYLGLGDITRSAGYQPLFDTLYVLQNFLDDDTFTDFEREHGIVGVDFVDTTHYPLTWVLTPGERLGIKLEYRPDVVDADAAAAMVERLCLAVESLLTQPDTAVGDLDLTLPAERDDARARSGGRPTRHRRRHHRRPARRPGPRCPDDTALVFGDDSADLRRARRPDQPAGPPAAGQRRRPRTDRRAGPAAVGRHGGGAVRGAAHRRGLSAAGARLPGRPADRHARRRPPVLLVCHGGSADVADHQRGLGGAVLALDDPDVRDALAGDVGRARSPTTNSAPSRRVQDRTPRASGLRHLHLRLDRQAQGRGHARTAA